MKISEQIKKLRDNLNNPNIPEDLRKSIPAKIAILETELAKETAKAAKPAIEKIVKKATRKGSPFNKFADEAQKRASADFAAKKKSVVDYDCDDLIEKEKAKLVKRKAADKKRAAKSEKTKNVERVAKVTELVEDSIEQRIEHGKAVSAIEIRNLIDKYKKSIADLEKLLKKISGEEQSNLKKLITPNDFWLVFETVSGEGYSDPKLKLVASKSDANVVIDNWKAEYKDYEKDWDKSSNGHFLEDEDENFIRIDKIALNLSASKGDYVIIKYSEPNEVEILEIVKSREAAIKKLKSLSSKEDWEDEEEVEDSNSDNPLLYAGHGSDGFIHYEGMLILQSI